MTIMEEAPLGPVVVKFKEETEKRQVTATIPLPAYLKLQQLAAPDQRSVSFVINQAISRFLSRKK